MTNESRPDWMAPDIDELPWHIVDFQVFRRGGPPNPADPNVRASRNQRVEGLAEPVAAFLRALADQIDPPRPVKRGPFPPAPPPGEIRGVRGSSPA